ncbi:MAG TPA: sugar ABC transporter ATP-binding protein, partial [Anaerolineales bacterium]|nr:sugar ABC transporter ATP-binding protein [Anaerolineales bacterium]
LRLGIEVVHQEVDSALIPTLSVAENLAIETLAEPTSGVWLNRRQLRADADAALERVGLEVDVRWNVDRLSLHEKQLLLIARAVSRNVRYLILDEPTASLSTPEVERLFAVLRDVRARGVGVIYISHRLGELADLVDEITVLRNGRVGGSFPKSTPLSDVVAAMFGQSLDDIYPPRMARKPGPVLLDVVGLRREPDVAPASFIVRRGEILGVAGLVGSGKSELLRLLAGADRAEAGSIRVDGTAVTLRQPADAVRAGIYLVPEERRRQGLWLERPLRENISLSFLPAVSAWGWLVQRARELKLTTQAIERVGLTPPDPEQAVQYLSGGNQQKAVIGRWLGGHPRVLLFDEPTQGIDLGARRDLFHIVQQVAEQAAVIYASSDLDEVLAIADRVLVMRGGVIVGDVRAEPAARRTILELATGVAPALEGFPV